MSRFNNKQDDDFSQKIPSKTVYFETKTKEDVKKLIDLGLTQYTSEDKKPFFIVKAKAEMPIYFKDSDEKIMKNMSIKTVNTQTMEEETNPNILKEKLAYDITKRVHGKEEADKALNTAKEIFSGKINTEALPIVKVSTGENMLDVCIKAGFGKSRGEIKKLIASNSITLGEKTIEVGRLVEEKDLEEGNNILKKGKKVIVKLEKE